MYVSPPRGRPCRTGPVVPGGAGSVLLFVREPSSPGAGPSQLSSQEWVCYESAEIPENLSVLFLDSPRNGPEAGCQRRGFITTHTPAVAADW